MDMHARCLDAQLALLLNEATTPPRPRRRREVPLPGEHAPADPKDAPRPRKPPGSAPNDDDTPMPTSEVEDRYWDWIERPN
jgi:hypothetical protein